MRPAPAEAGSSTLTAVTMVPGRPDDGDESVRADGVGTALATADAEAADRTEGADHPDDDDGEAPTMSWWQDGGGADDRLTADETAVAAVTEVATARFPALAVQGLLLTGDRATGEDVAYEALARLRRDWYRLADPEQATAYLQGAVTALARQRIETGGLPPSAESAAPAVDLDTDDRRTTSANDLAGDTSAGNTSAGAKLATPDPSVSDAAPIADAGTDEPGPVEVRAALGSVATDEREGLVLHHHLNLPEHETALCLCTAVAPLRTLLTGGITQLRTVLGDPVAGYDDQRLAGLLASAGSDVVATLDRDRLAGALTGTRRHAVVPRRRRRVDAAFVLLGILVGGAVAVGAVWRSHTSTAHTAAAIRPAVVSTIVGGRGGSTTLVTAARPAAAPATTVAPTTTPTTATPTPANDVLAVAITPPPTDAPIPTATTRATAPARTPVTTVASATTAQTAPPVPTASPTTAPAPATTVAATAPPATVAPTTPAPPTTPAATTAPFRGWSIAQYGCARSDSSFFASGTADPAAGSVAVTGPGFSLSSPISASGTWRVSAGSVSATQQGSFTFKAATTGRGANQSQNVICS